MNACLSFWTLCTNRTLRTSRALSSRCTGWPLFAPWTCGAGRARFSLCALWAGRASGASGALFTLRPLLSWVALGALDAFRGTQVIEELIGRCPFGVDVSALFAAGLGGDPHKRALRQTIGGITLVHGGNGIIYLLNEERISLVSLGTLDALRALRADTTGRTLWSLWPLGPRGSPFSLDTLRAFRSLYTGLALWSCGTSWASRPSRPFHALLALNALRSGRSGRSRGALVSLRARVALRDAEVKGHVGIGTALFNGGLAPRWKRLHGGVDVRDYHGAAAGAGTAADDHCANNSVFNGHF